MRKAHAWSGPTRLLKQTTVNKHTTQRLFAVFTPFRSIAFFMEPTEHALQTQARLQAEAESGRAPPPLPPLDGGGGGLPPPRKKTNAFGDEVLE